MAHLFRRPRRRRASADELMVCALCGSDFVSPVEWAEHDETRWWIRLRCGECGETREVVVPQGAADRYDRASETISTTLARLDRERILRPQRFAEVLRGHASLSDCATRSAFLHTLRTIVDLRGQRVDASDRLYLAQALPFLVVWGDRDPIIPVEHAHAAHRLVPGSRLEIFPGAGHFPHLDDPLRFVRLLTDFMRTTEPAHVPAARWGDLRRSFSGTD